MGYASSDFLTRTVPPVRALVLKQNINGTHFQVIRKIPAGGRLLPAGLF